MHKQLISFVVFTLQTLVIWAQKPETQVLRDSLRVWSNQLKTERNSNESSAISLKMEKAIVKTYNGKANLGAELDSLPNIGQITPPDQAFRIVNWNTIDSAGSHVYYAVVLHQGPQKLWVASILHDSTDLNDVRENRKIGPDNWYGALYYKAIVSKWKKKTLYTLLGWDGHDRLTNRKLVDVISFEKGRPVFGSPVFKVDRKTRHRLVYEYGEEATMLLRFDEKIGMIVMDHLAPKEPYLKGNFQFYGPDLSHDGLEFYQGKWIFNLDIDARNRKERGKKFIQP